MKVRGLEIPDIPAFRQSEMISTDRDFGPSVPTIFVIAGKKVCRENIQLETWKTKHLHSSVNPKQRFTG